jgi:benzoyl-CoA reductase subunit BamB
MNFNTRNPLNHWKKRFPELEKELLDTYYAFRGWNEQGIPTEEALRELGLEYVYEAFEKQGIYSENRSDNGDAPSPATPAETGKEV